MICLALVWALFSTSNAGSPVAVAPQPESLETLAKQLAATAAPSVAHQLEQISRQSGDPETAGIASFALGYSAFQNGQFAVAADFLAQPALKNLLIADYAALYLARSQHRLKSLTPALATLEDFSVHFPTSRLTIDATLERCQIWVDRGEAAQCMSLLEGLPGFGSSPRLMFAAAQVQEAASDWKAEAELLQHIAYGYPLSPEAAQAKEGLQQLRRRHPSSVSAPSAHEVLARAQIYFDRKRYKEALEDYQSLARAGAKLNRGLSQEEQLGVTLRVAQCYLYMGRLREAANFLAKASPLAGEAEAERLYALAELKRKRSTVSSGEFERAVLQLEEKFPSSPWAEAAIFALGNYFLVHHDRPRATEEFEKLLKEFPAGKNAPEALFRVAWSVYLQRDYREARVSFRQFVGLYPQSSRTVAALYWLGRIAEMTEPSEAPVFYGAVSRDFGESLYAQSARERLAKLRPKPEGDKPNFQLPDVRPRILLREETPPDRLTQDSLKRADLFRRISLTDLAVSELRALLEHTRSIEATRELAQIYLTRQNYGAAMVTVRQAFPDYYRASVDELPGELWRGLFPLPYWSTIQSEAERRGVDPYLVASLIRQESAFNAEAKSPANAQGLMQLLPREARKYARKERIPRWRPKQAYDPVINIRLGVAYLADTLHRFNGNVELALAAYNAGDDRVTAWTEEHSMAGMVEDPMEFIESIPFTETREYVQILLRNLSYYKKIYAQVGAGGALPALFTPAPE